MKISGSYQKEEEEKKKNNYLCNKTTSIGVNRAVEFKCIFFVIYTTSSDYQEHFVDSSYQVIFHILFERTETLIHWVKHKDPHHNVHQY